MRYLFQRAGFYLVAFWVSLTLNFLLPRLMPGDPITRMFVTLSGQLRPDQLENLRRLYGLTDDPIWVQYFQYLGSIFTGNLGISISRFPTPVTEIIGSQIGWTVLLGTTSLIVAAAIGIVLGIIVARRPGGIADSILPPLIIFVGSFPYFWLAMALLFLFGVTLQWFPLQHAYSLGISPSWSLEFIGNVGYHLVLPATTLVLVSLGGWLLGMRNTMITTNSEDYITMAHAKGLTDRRITLRYSARNALLPSVTAFGMSLGFIVGGALLTEIVFAYPGVGFQLVSAVQSLDYPLLQGIFLVITAAVLIANFLVDIVYVRLDPRVTHA